MPTTGEDLIAAIVGNETLMAINNCPGVSAQMGKAFYGDWQDDDNAVTIALGSTLIQDIKSLIKFSGQVSETAVWHFSMTGKVHHFVVVPWRRSTKPKRVYTVFMAYEHRQSSKAYTLDKYVKGTAPAPPLDGNGYRETWTIEEFGQMLYYLLKQGAAWERYFGKVGRARATSITCYKYANISLDDAIDNVNGYVG